MILRKGLELALSLRAESFWNACYAPVHSFWSAEWSTEWMGTSWSWLKGTSRALLNGEEVVFFRKEDLSRWTVFTITFIVLIIFDNAVLHRKARKLSFLTALLHTCFWLACAACFCLYVYHSRGPEDAVSWGTGYLLEWMLSIDNLFVFHRVFEVFQTPDEQKHKPLFYGIVGAIIFRMIFFMVEDYLMNHIKWMHILFGVFLIYTGIKAVAWDDEDSPENGYVFQQCVKHIAYVDRYEPSGRFFAKVRVIEETGEVLPPAPLSSRAGRLSPRSSLRRPSRDCSDSAVERPRRSAGSASADAELAEVELGPGVVERWRATRLVLVVVCLEITDLVFAVDSVSAIIAQIPDLFLAYTACVFAMLGLRALYFAIDELVKLFSMLQYGVAAILIFLGAKLIMRTWLHIPPMIVCVILLTTLGLSIAASVVADRLDLCDEDKDVTEDVEGTGPEEVQGR